MHGFPARSFISVPTTAVSLRHLLKFYGTLFTWFISAVAGSGFSAGSSWISVCQAGSKVTITERSSCEDWYTCLLIPLTFGSSSSPISILQLNIPWSHLLPWVLFLVRLSSYCYLFLNLLIPGYGLYVHILPPTLVLSDISPGLPSAISFFSYNFLLFLAETFYFL